MVGNVDADPFKKGTQVEVSLDDDGFQGSWYTATVVRPISKKTHKIHLEFHTLTSGVSQTDSSSRSAQLFFTPIALGHSNASTVTSSLFRMPNEGPENQRRPKSSRTPTSTLALS
ncbi:Uncharacterized protein Fot_25017 [Forsythia ovata]|uniref:Agenet-like domain-containing protein n=1 Tax=Forsythia ovata TaxID=205694 RepID=A0ABD1U7Y1_9LAMI